VNMASGVLVHGVNTLVLIATYPLYLHFLGKETYGLWLTLSVVPTFIQLGDFGINQAVTKLVAEEYGGRDSSAAGQYIAMALAMLLLSGVTGLVAIFSLRTQIVGLLGLKGANAHMALWLIPVLGSLSVYGLIVNAFNAAVAGFGRMDIANYIQAAGRIVSLGVALAFLAAGHALESLVMGLVAANVITHLATVVCIRSLTSVRIFHRGNWSPARTRRLLAFGTPVFGSGIVSMLMDPLNRVVLSRFAGPGSVVVYDIASRGCLQIRSVITLALRALVPEVSRLSASGTAEAHAAVRRILRRATRLAAFYSVPFFAALCVLAPWFLKIWLRSEFTADMPSAFQVMAIATYASLVGVPAYFTLMGLNRVGQVFSSHVVQSVVSALGVAVLLILAVRISPFAICVFALLGTSASTLFLLTMVPRSLRQMEFAEHSSVECRPDLG